MFRNKIQALGRSHCSMLLIIRILSQLTSLARGAARRVQRLSGQPAVDVRDARRPDRCRRQAVCERVPGQLREFCRSEAEDVAGDQELAD